MFTNTNNSKKKNIFSVSNKMYSILLILFFLFISFTLNAQCAMCRAALTSEGNTSKAEAVNDGIVYLMAIPYVLVGGIGYAIYRMKKR